MTSPNNIVTEMIDRLRVLQGSGEFPPLTRKISAGEGLAGGGDLRADMELSLDQQVLDLVQQVADRGDLSALVTAAEMTQALEDYVRAESVAPRVFYRDFSITEAPLTAVTAPPIRADQECAITRITVVVGNAGSQPVRVTVAGHSVEVPARIESGAVDVEIARTAGQSIPVTVAATDAAGIVVSLRFEEAGTR